MKKGKGIKTRVDQNGEMKVAKMIKLGRGF